LRAQTLGPRTIRVVTRPAARRTATELGDGVHVSNLRRKLGGHRNVVRTVRGVGYGLASR
jgi:DNA-binding response OmpR family regulator